MAGSPLFYAELQPQAWKVLITGQGIISLTFVIANCYCAEADSEQGGGIVRDLLWSELQARGWRHKGSIAVAIQASYTGSQGQWGLRWNISGHRWLKLLLFLCFGDLQAHMPVGIKK